MADGSRNAAGRAKTRATPKASLRLRRLLSVVPYIVQHPGVAVSEVSALFGVQERELLQDLNLLFMAGLPPYGPGDLIDVQIEEGRVWIGMADYFSRPVRLTISEAFALYLRGKALLGTPGLQEAAALSSALDKIETSLGPDALSRLVERVEVETGAGLERTLDTLRRAAEERRTLEIEYYAASRDELTGRAIDPEHVFAAIGHWYVVAWDHASDDERMFRADRIRSVRETTRTFDPRGLPGPERPLYTRSDGDLSVTLRLRPAARWVAEYYVTERALELEDGSLEVTIPTKDLPWVAKLVLRLAGEATVLGPPELLAMVRADAERTIALYRRRD